tara:strand:- start:27140 stop:27853 length:714 start_codon:yes stop_codon:yes gene_type:complete
MVKSRLNTVIKWFAILFWVIAVIAIGWYSYDRLPPEHNPFVPLSIEDPIGLATGTKISGLKSDPSACFSFLDEARIRYTALDASPPGEPCGFYNALTLDRSALPYNSTLRMTCGLTAALAVWERQALVPRAAEYFEAPPVKVLSFGSYSCRRLYGRSSGRYSQHATGNAIDIQGVELADGTRITLLEHWGQDSPKGRFLKALRDDSCELFSTVLGPDYNAAHANHFHLDMSPTGVCR